MKWIKRILIVGVLLIVAAVVIVYYSVNSILRSTIERQATASLGVPTTLDAAHLSILGGKVDLDNLQVSSPPDFSAPHIFTLGGIAVGVHYGELTSTPIHIQQIIVDHPVLVVQQSNIQLNLQALMKQMPQTPKTSSGQETQPIKLVIDDLELNGAQVTLMPGIPGLTDTIQVPIASLSLKGIGTSNGNQNGAAIKDVVLQVCTALASKAVDASKLSPEVKLVLTQEIGALQSGTAGDLGSQLQNAAGGAAKQLAPKLQDSLDDLLNGKKKSK